VGLDGYHDNPLLGRRLDELIALGGEEKIAAMLRRFSDQLGSFLALDPTQNWPVASVHRMVGLAAILGFSQVEATWRKLETAEAQATDRFLARQAAEAAISFVKGWSKS